MLKSQKPADAFDTSQVQQQVQLMYCSKSVNVHAKAKSAIDVSHSLTHLKMSECLNKKTIRTAGKFADCFLKPDHPLTCSAEASRQSAFTAIAPLEQYLPLTLESVQNLFRQSGQLAQNQPLYLYQMFPDFEDARQSLQLSLKPQVTDIERAADPSIYVIGENLQKIDVSDAAAITCNSVDSAAVPSIHGYLSQNELDFIVHPYNCIRRANNIADSTSSLEPQEQATLFDSLLHQETKADSPIKSALRDSYLNFGDSEKKDSFQIDDISLTKLLTRSPQRNPILKNVSTKSFIYDAVQDNLLSEEQVEFLKQQTDYTFECIDLIEQRKLKDLANIDAQTQNQQYKIYSKLSEFYPFDEEKNDDNIYFGLVSDQMLQLTDNLLLPEDLQGQPEELEQEEFDDFVKQRLNSLNRNDVPTTENDMKVSDGYLANQQNRQQNDGELYFNNELKFHFIGKDYEGQLKNYKLK